MLYVCDVEVDSYADYILVQQTLQQAMGTSTPVVLLPESDIREVRAT